MENICSAPLGRFILAVKNIVLAALMLYDTYTVLGLLIIAFFLRIHLKQLIHLTG